MNWDPYWQRRETSFKRLERVTSPTASCLRKEKCSTVRARCILGIEGREFDEKGSRDILKAPQQHCKITPLTLKIRPKALRNLLMLLAPSSPPQLFSWLMSHQWALVKSSERVYASAKGSTFGMRWGDSKLPRTKCPRAKVYVYMTGWV